MDTSQKHKNPSPLEKAGFFSRLFFWWLNSLFSVGYKRSLEVEDMYNVVDDDSTERLSALLHREWEAELRRPRPSLTRAFVRAYLRRFMALGVIVCAEEVLRVLQPVLLGLLLHYFTPGSEMTAREAYLYAGGLAACAFLACLTHHPYFFGVQRLGMWMRVSACALIYNKSLRLSHTAMAQTTTGHVVNLMSNDVVRFDFAPMFLHYVWLGPLQALFVLVYLWRSLGVATLGSFIILIALIPVQGSMGRLFSKLRRQVAVHTDERVRLMSEVLGGARVIKMYCWEPMFASLIARVRKKETGRVATAAYSRASILAPFFSSAKVMVYATVLWLVLAGSPITPQRVFVMIALYNPVRLNLHLFLPFAITFTSEARATLARIQEFLLLDELKQSHTEHMPGEPEDTHPDTESSHPDTQHADTKHRYIESTHPKSADTNGADPKSAALQPVEASRALNGRLCNRSGGGPLIKVCSISASWSQPPAAHCKDDKVTDKGLTLSDLSFEVRPGQLLAVIGPVGAGKSSLLAALLGELPLCGGSLSLRGSVAYAAQQPWVFSGSVRQNVLFGQPYLKRKYERALAAAALNKDLSLLSRGDATLVGERGVSLSGGQKVRLSLARALYADRDLYLLDDPLSAVDAAVGRHLFDKCIMGELRDKPRVLVTHQLQYLQRADAILVVKEGRCAGLGTFAELSRDGVDFATLLKHEEEAEKQEEAGSRAPQRPELSDLLDRQLDRKRTMSETEAGDDWEAGFPLLQHRSLTELRHRRPRHPAARPPAPPPASPAPVVRSLAASMENIDSRSLGSVLSLDDDIQAEHVEDAAGEARAEGTVRLRCYANYFRAGGGACALLLLLATNLLAQAAFIASDWWLSYWATVEEERALQMELFQQQQLEASLGNSSSFDNVTSAVGNSTGVEEVEPIPRSRYIYIYTAITALVFALGLARALLIFRVLLAAARRLHDRMLGAVLRCPVRFFDVNPTGRVLNRFSKDQGLLDESLPLVIFDFLQCALLIAGSVLVCGLINPWVFLPTLPLAAAFVLVRKYYLATSRDVKRLEATTRSPVYSHVSSTMAGLQTIRAYRAQHTFISEFHRHQNEHSEAWFLFLATSRWFAVRLDLLCACFLTSVALCSVLAASSLSGGLVGLTMTYAMTLMGLFQWGVRQSAEVENQMTSVERVLEYTELAAEAPLRSACPPPADWPQQGGLSAQGVSFSHAPELPPVLTDLTFTIHPREKVGVVGRTGAGKSSLVALLFRLAEARGGAVRVDGLDVAALGLHELRAALAAIPQDPLLFSGSVRRNLDPFTQHSDATLWQALDEVQLGGAVRRLAGGLEHAVKEGGSNLSVGQRQLLCLARASLSNTRILVIDEATANVDPRTDALIQQTIRDKFARYTVLTIAHRLHTIMDCDRVMVLEAGRLVEFAEPHVLLQRPDSLLAQLAAQTGPAQLAQLQLQALKHYNGR